MAGSRLRRATLALLYSLLYAAAALLLLAGLTVAAIETDWGKDQLRRLIIHEGNQYLAGTLEIGRLGGSILHSLTIQQLRLSQDGATIISADEIALDFSIRDLVDSGTTVRSIRVARPYVVVARLPDGRWNLGALLKRQERENPHTGPGRPLHLEEIHIVDGDVTFRDPIMSGSVQLPSHFARLAALFSFDDESATWRMNFSNASWAGDEVNLGVNRLSGRISDGPLGWQLDGVDVQTARSAFTVDGRINRGAAPTTLDLHVAAKRFAFQEWSRVVEALGHMDIEGTFDLTLKGPPTALTTALTLRSSNAGDIEGRLVLNASVPGWHGAGAASVVQVNLAHWLDRADRPTDVTGRLTFDLDFVPPQHHFPRGAFSFEGPHASYLEYEIENLRARGTVTGTDVLIADATGTMYGSALRVVAGSIGIDAPNAYHFEGEVTGLDLRQLPASVPVTHVESVLAFDAFDVSGQFVPLSLAGQARFGDSTYLGARIEAGAVGAIDTSATPIRYRGEGSVSGLDIHRFGERLATDWMLDPRWAGVVAGHFHVEGSGSDPATRTLDGGGRLTRADMFGGRLFDADVDVHIADGSLRGSYDGRLAGVDMTRAFADPRFDATVTGTGRAHFAVRDILLRNATLADYDVDGTLDATNSLLEGIGIDTGTLTGKLLDSTLAVTSARVSGPKVDAIASGVLELDGERSSQLDYNVTRADVSLANDATARRLAGTIATTGHLTGPTSAVRFVGDGHVSDFKELDAEGAGIASAAVQYDVTVPTDDLSRTTARVTARASVIEVLNRQIPEADATITYSNPRVDVDVVVGTDERVTGSALLHPDRKAVDLAALTVTVGPTAWRLIDASPPPTVSWDDGGVDAMPLVFDNTSGGAGRLTIAGTWRIDGSGTLRLAGRGVALEALLGAAEQPVDYGGVADFDATLSGTRDRPTATAQIAITEGRVRKLTYQRLAGRAEYRDGLATLDFRLDQGPDTWLTAVGTVPIGLTDAHGPGRSDQPVDLTVASSAVSLGLLEDLTSLVHNVSGTATFNVRVTGTSGSPHFDGSLEFADTGFVVASTGARYQNGRASFQLATDRLNVRSFHLEDRHGQALAVTGSIGTQALTVGDLQIDIVAHRFEVLHNQTGSVNVDARLALRGEVNAPSLTGDVTVLSGELKIDQIFSEALYQPYSTQEIASTKSAPSTSTAAATNPMDALAALNPWDSLSLAINLRSRGTLRLTGDNVQVAQGTPLGLGSFNLHATGDLYLLKDRGQRPDVSGSFDSITGSLAFQGRRFDLDPASSVNFHGDLDPEIYVTVSRFISGVDARVTISGTVHAPELRLASTPPLESSDILSLILFNASTNDLSAPQQQELAVRAGTLAYGFVATPLISALQRSIGLETLEIAPPAAGNTGPRVTVGNELVPGLVAQFTRQFGEEAYDEATVEYIISRIFRVRATFSDAGAAVQQLQAFQRIERAGIDFLLFFSF